MGANASTEQPIQGRALERYRLIQSYLQGTTALATVAGNAGVSLRTAQRWVEKYRKQGVGALGTKERIDRGQRRAMSPKMVELTEGLALERPRVPVTEIYRELGEFAAKSGERLPSYPAVRRAVKAIPISLMTLAHSGSRAYSERFDLIHRREAREKAVADPTTLIVVDEADRLRMTSLEQLRAIFDEGSAGLILIGMPGIEQRVARFAQLYSRIGFVHEFRPLGETEIESLLETTGSHGEFISRSANDSRSESFDHPHDGRQLSPSQTAACADRTCSRCK